MENEINERIESATKMYHALNRNFISKKKSSEETKVIV